MTASCVKLFDVLYFHNGGRQNGNAAERIHSRGLNLYFFDSDEPNPDAITFREQDKALPLSCPLFSHCKTA